MKVSAGVKYVIGIDEVGRGPLAGPVAVGVCLVSVKMTRRSLLTEAAQSGKLELRKLNDSKKLSAKRREAWLSQMCEMQKARTKTEKSRRLDFSVTLISNKVIDNQGLSFAIRKAK